MKIFNFIRKLLKKILFPNTYSSDAYINYLRKRGYLLEKDVIFGVRIIHL